MLTLYYRPTCPFCRRVLAVSDRLKLEIELKDIEDTSVEAELISLGGKKQVPYLVDSSNNTSMYESDDIVNYLQTTYGQVAPSVAKPRMHIGDNVCVSCEG